LQRWRPLLPQQAEADGQAQGQSIGHPALPDRQAQQGRHLEGKLAEKKGQPEREEA
jgi:hypothetical protein